MSPRSGKRRSCAWEAIRRSPYAIAHLPESMKSPDLYMSLVRENPQTERRPPRSPDAGDEPGRLSSVPTGKDKTDFSVISALSDPALVLQVFREQATRSRYTG